MLYRNLLFVLSALLCTIAAVVPVRGAGIVNPGSIQSQQIRDRENDLKKIELKEELKSREEKELQDSAGKTGAESLKLEKHEPGEYVIFLKKIEVNKSDLLPEKLIEPYIEFYEGKEVSLKDLKNLVAAINKLYKDRSTHTALAILPEQDISDGTVKIKLVEGRLSRLTINNNKYTKSSYIEKRLDIPEGEVLRLNEVEKELAGFNRANDIKLFAKLAPGKEYGTTDISLEAVEPNNFHVYPYVNNRGRKSIGYYQGGTSVIIDSVLGYRDSFSADFAATEGNRSMSGSYSLPVNRYNTRLGASYSYNRMKITGTSLEVLGIEGNSSVFTMSLIHPLINDFDKRMNIYLGYDYKKTETTITGELYRDESYHDITAGFEFQKFIKGGLIYTSHRFMTGLDRSGTYLAEDDDFYKYNADFINVLTFREKFQNTLKASVQYGSDSMSSLEYFQMGGMNSVRGYSEGLISGYNGYSLSEEVRFPCILLPGSSNADEGKINLRKYVDGVLFVDFAGWFKESDFSFTGKKYICGIGTGLRINIGRNLTAAVDLGVPLVKPDGLDVSSPRLHFSITMNALDWMFE